MATTKTDAQKVEEYRKMAQDKTLPPEVREKYDMRANEIEKKAVEKTGVKLAKGGAVKKPLPTRGGRTATNMAKGGSVAKKAKRK